VAIPPTCKTGNFKCVGAAPAGWSSPFAFFTGASAPPPCPAEAPLAEVTANTGLGAVPPAQCAACACTATNLGCAKAKATAFASATCTGACNDINATANLSNGSCTAFDCTLSTTEASIYVDAPLVTATCTPQAAKPTATLPSIPWATKVLGCRAPTLAQVDCSAGQVCATTLGSPFATGMCVAKDGDVACPTVGYTVKKPLSYRGVTDTRDCGSCTCGAVSGTCAATITAYTRPVVACASAVAAPVTVPGCVAQGSGVAYLYQATVPGSATCPAGGGAPTGTAVPATPVTVCCEP
jgi:hypothetical protein